MRKDSRLGLVLLFHREKQVEAQPHVVVLAIRLFGSVVLVFVIEIEFDVLTHRKQRTNVEIGGAPLVVLTLIEGFGGDVR